MSHRTAKVILVSDDKGDRAVVQLTGYLDKRGEEKVPFEFIISSREYNFSFSVDNHQLLECDQQQKH